jgi:hypothetical protein
MPGSSLSLPLLKFVKLKLETKVQSEQENKKDIGYCVGKFPVGQDFS